VVHIVLLAGSAALARFNAQMALGGQAACGWRPSTLLLKIQRSRQPASVLHSGSCNLVAIWACQAVAIGFEMPDSHNARFETNNCL
jgi:hypothetical protein